MDYFLVYLWTRLDGIKWVLGFFSTIGVIGIIILGLAALIFNDCNDFPKESVKRCLKYLCVTILITMPVDIAIPSKKDMLLIYFIPQVAHSEAITDTMDVINKLPKALGNELKKYLEEGTEKVTK